MSNEPDATMPSEKDLREQDTRDRERRVERGRWAELRNIYERCVKIAQQVWDEKLDAAVIAQRKLAETMRDRLDGMVLHEIPVPLFTPRDRLQFLKEASVALLIEANRRNLTVKFREPYEATEEAAPATDDTALDAEAGEIAAQGSPSAP